MPSPDEDIKLGHLITPQLLAGLAKVFPLRRPLPEETERTIWIHSGQQSVIEFLQQEHERAIEQSMEG